MTAIENAVITILGVKGSN